jgi:hypothetical protein
MLLAPCAFADKRLQTYTATGITAIIGVSRLQEFLQEDLANRKLIKTASGTALIFRSTSLNSEGIARGDSLSANALELDFDDQRILSTIQLIRTNE